MFRKDSVGHRDFDRTIRAKVRCYFLIYFVHEFNAETIPQIAPFSTDLDRWVISQDGWLRFLIFKDESADEGGIFSAPKNGGARNPILTRLDNRKRASVLSVFTDIQIGAHIHASFAQHFWRDV